MALPIDTNDDEAGGAVGMGAGGCGLIMEADSSASPLPPPVAIDRWRMLLILLLLWVFLFLTKVDVIKYPGSGKRSKPFAVFSCNAKRRTIATK